MVQFGWSKYIVPPYGIDTGLTHLISIRARFLSMPNNALNQCENTIQKITDISLKTTHLIPGLVMPHGVVVFGHHWFRMAYTCTNDDLLLIRSLVPTPVRFSLKTYCIEKYCPQNGDHFFRLLYVKIQPHPPMMTKLNLLVVLMAIGSPDCAMGIIASGKVIWEMSLL